MSMPVIEINDIDRNQALINIVASIALEEAALSHILNAEGEKIQAAIELLGGKAETADDIQQLTEINESVGSVVDGASKIESTLKEKLEAIIDLILFTP
jgi:RNA processing factor Prp31